MDRYPMGEGTLEDARKNAERDGRHDLRRTCSLDYCDKSPRSSREELCEGHYYQRRRGKPFTPLRPAKFEGDTCHIEGCEKPRKGKFCTMHAARIRRHGDPSKVIGQNEIARLHGPDNPMWQEAPSYSAWHQRLNRAKGPASRHECSEGCGAKAAQWSYVGPREPNRRKPYEIDFSLFVPKCVKCHKRYDLAKIALTDRRIR